MYYNSLLVARILLTLLPQNGYIHADEFFQSTEVLGGKFLNVENRLTWEFNTTDPIRSMTLQYFTIGMSFKIFQGIQYLLNSYLSYNMNSTYFILLFPRLFMCFSSYIVDYCLYKICTNNNEKYQSRLLILSSSYVILVYATRTFSNSLELILFSLLLYYVSESLTFSNIVVKRKEYVKYRYENSKTVVEKAKFHKINLLLKQDLLRNAFKISTIVVLGFFNRPTFLAFSTVPVFFWLYRGIGSKTLSSINFHYRIIVLLLWSLPPLLFIIIADSFYYGFLTWGEIGVLDISINNFVFTPLNFLRYNLNFKNLETHGTHSRYLNFINMPLLFNVLALFNFLAMLEYFQRLVNSKFNLLPSVKSIKGLMTLSILAPFIILSYFPHQEPRFLIPLLLPLVYLYGNLILPEKEYNVTTPHPGIKANSIKPRNKKVFYFWIATNLILVIFYGFLHQGGIIKLASYLSKTINTHSHTHVVTSHSYMIPKHLVLIPQKENKSKNVFSKGEENHLIIHEEGSSSLDMLLNKLEYIYNTQKIYNKNIKNDIFKSKVYLVIPNCFKEDINISIKKYAMKLKEIKTFYPHLSVESLQKVQHKLHSVYINNFNFSNFIDYFYSDLLNFTLEKFWGLTLYHVY